MRFGTQDKDFFPVDFVEKFKQVKELGFDTFEIDGKALVEHLDQVKLAIETTGVQVLTACGGYRGWIGDFIEEKRLNGVEDLKAIIRALKEVGGKGVVVPAAWGMFTFRLPPMVSPRSKEGDTKAILQSLAALDPVAAENGIQIYLEPLNRYQDHMMNTIQDARDIIEAGKFTNVKIIGDFYHMNIEEDDISASFRKHRDLIQHVHIADNHRYQPGSGSIDFKHHFETLRSLDYDGVIVYECRVRGDNHLEEYAKSIARMKQLYL
ncbi:sugar phosphate isomerase/epimerase [Paenibacillus sp. OV219]|uniref:sugar phosphate isomerase/epimerase family protein n=1 Tax=Paenibacillus sp. OV219 TaxID=1884377 RepID=UPI0008CD7BB1|nr:sugar phosphate isomerase/epimerase [Paenibacillus sp. OV219]SEO12458.1 Sugar phosphate isomerase/epimerase [Paenibacillus sp. OV219]